MLPFESNGTFLVDGREDRERKGAPYIYLWNLGKLDIIPPAIFESAIFFPPFFQCIETEIYLKRLISSHLLDC